MSADLKHQAQDPNTPLTQLQHIAQHYPELRPLIAANPSTYPALLDWLGALGDPKIDRALDKRLEQARAAAAAMSQSGRRVRTPDTDKPHTPASKPQPAKSQPTSQPASTPQPTSTPQGQQQQTQATKPQPQQHQPPASKPQPQQPQDSPSRPQFSPVVPGRGAEDGPSSHIPSVTPTAQPTDSGKSATQSTSTAATQPATGTKPAETTTPTTDTQPTADAKPVTDAKPVVASDTKSATTQQVPTHSDAQPADEATRKQAAIFTGPNISGIDGNISDGDDDDDDEGDDKPKKSKKFFMWLIGIIIVLALVGAGLTVGILTDSLPFISDSDPAAKDNNTTQTTPGATKDKGAKGVQDASEDDANGNGIPDSQEKTDKSKATSSPKFGQQDRIVVEPPEGAADEKPVPDGAITNLENFANGNETIQCAIGEGGIQCALNEPASSLDINNHGKPFSVTMDQSDNIELAILDSKVANTGQVRLSANAAVTRGDFVCQGTNNNGVDCWRVSTAHGFILSPTSVQQY